MALHSDTTSLPTAVSVPSEISRVYVEGVVAGLIGAATIAVWFLILDIYNGRPFYTPHVSGAALSLSGTIPDSATASISMELVVFYTWVHALVFCGIGGLAAKLLSLMERDLNFGFGILLLFVIFEFGFVAATMVFAEPRLRALACLQFSSAIYLRRVRWQSTFGTIIRSCGSLREYNLIVV